MHYKSEKKTNTPAGMPEYSGMLLKTVRKEDIHVFPEKRRVSEAMGMDSNNTAYKLFCMFTADIIRQKTLFVR